MEQLQNRRLIVCQWETSISGKVTLHARRKDSMLFSSANKTRKYLNTLNYRRENERERVKSEQARAHIRAVWRRKSKRVAFALFSLSYLRSSRQRFTDVIAPLLSTCTQTSKNLRFCSSGLRNTAIFNASTKSLLWLLVVFFCCCCFFSFPVGEWRLVKKKKRQK